jgi:hypothetical protein
MVVAVVSVVSSNENDDLKEVSGLIIIIPCTFMNDSNGTYTYCGVKLTLPVSH